MKKKETNENLVTRPPIVVVLGHVNHGKTSLLDYVRKTKVVDKEAGHITQHIGAYEAVVNGRKITFIDTPGHEAFSKIRSRGAKVADIAILVVAADEGVKPQTKESIKIIQETKTPLIVAITKIDKPNIDVEKVKRELLENGVLLEKLGGDVPFQLVSSKTGEGIDELLEMILLVADMEELKADKSKSASGVVIESHLDRFRGITATLIITNGTLKTGDNIYTSQTSGKIKILENFQGEKIDQATFSSPVRVVGFEVMPLVGEKWAVNPKDLVREKSIKQAKQAKNLGDKESSVVIPLIIKADVFSSLDALEEVIDKLGKEKKWQFSVLVSKIGDISQGDLRVANPEGTLVIGFRVRQKPEIVNSLLANSQIKILTSDIIYELLDKIGEVVEKEFIEKPTEKIIGQVLVKAIFHPVKGKQLIGGEVTEGVVTKNAIFNVVRGEEQISSGRVINLQKERQDVNKVEKGEECGLLIDCSQKIEKDDILQFFQKI